MASEIEVRGGRRAAPGRASRGGSRRLASRTAGSAFEQAEANATAQEPDSDAPGRYHSAYGLPSDPLSSDWLFTSWIPGSASGSFGS